MSVLVRSFLRPSLILAGFIAWTGATAPIADGTAPKPALAKGAHFDLLVVGKKSYADVTVREVTVRSILITTTDGIASIPLHELAPALQKAFAYDPSLEVNADLKLAKIQHAAQEQIGLQRQKRETELSDAVENRFARLLADFSRPPVVQPSVDLRPHFRELALGIKNQGARPSCAVFAVVSAFEFQNAELLGHPEKLSEDYLIWATRSALHHRPGHVVLAPTEGAVDEDEKDEGFSLSEVVAALRGFGIAPQSAMPDTFTKMSAIVAPSDELIRESSSRRKLTVHFIRGNDAPTRLGNIVHALNEGVPVPIGLRWPLARTIRTGSIDEQTPNEKSLHAVTIVGYVSPTEQLEDTVFIFKNSYGPNWGEAGYGRVTYRYLRENLLDAVVLEVQRPEEKTG